MDFGYRKMKKTANLFWKDLLLHDRRRPFSNLLDGNGSRSEVFPSGKYTKG